MSTASPKAKWSLYWLARNKPYWIVLLNGVLLAAAFPPSPFGFLIFFAFIPLFVLFETEVIPLRVPEDKIFRPFKTISIVVWRLLSLQFLYRRATKGGKVFSYRRQNISGNAQLFRYTYAIFLVWNILCCYWLLFTGLGASGLFDTLVGMTAGILVLIINPALMSVPFQFFSRIRHETTPIFAAGAFIFFWLAFEYLHGNWPMSWTWLNLGHSLSSFPSWIQYAEFTGVPGISFHILVANLLIYRLYRHWHFNKKIGPYRAAMALSWLFFPFFLNLFLLNPDREILRPEGELKVRIVQPNIDPYQQFNYFTPEEQVALFTEMTTRKPLNSIDLVVLPENAIPREMVRSSIAMNRLTAPLWHLVDSFDIEILTGMEESEIFTSEDEAPVSAVERFRRIGGQRIAVYIDHYNAATLLRADRLVDTYRKGKLVPLLERVPLLGLLDFLKKGNLDLGTGRGNYGLQDSMKVLETQEGLKLGVMIGYDSQFGEFASQSAALGAEALVILTNDGWWGNSSGYVQNAGFASLRAIENRKWVVRAANTGISSFTDPAGNRVSETEWWEPALLDGSVTLHKGETFYMRHGDYIGRIACWLTLLISIAGIVVNYRRKKRGIHGGISNRHAGTYSAGSGGSAEADG